MATRLPSTVSGASVKGGTLTVTFDEALATGSAPAGSAFALTATPAGGGAVRTVRGRSTVSILGSTATVTLVSAVRGGETVTLAYTKPGTNPLKDADDDEVATFTGQTVTNHTPVPAAGALVDEADGCLDAACPNAPTGTATYGPGHGEIKVDWSPAATGGAVSTWDVKHTTGGVPTLTSGLPAATRTHTFTGLDPTKLYDIVVQGVGAGDTYGDAAVARNIRPRDSAVSAFASASVNRTALSVTFDQALDIRSRPAGSAFTVTVTASDSTVRTLSGTGRVAVSGTTATVALAGPVLNGETVTVATVTVDWATADGTATAGEDYTGASGTLVFAPGERVKTVEVAALADEAAEDGETFTLALSNAQGATVADGEATGTVADAAPGAGAPLTAAFAGMPAEHDARTPFSFELRFSEEFRGLSYKVLRDLAFRVTHGRVTRAKRVEKGQNRRWTIEVRPASIKDVVVRLPATTDCALPWAVCTEAGRKLSNTVTATVQGPALLSAADARAREGIDPAVVFPVSLSRAASVEVTVDYRTADGTAKAGEDYAATSGTLTFAAGEREKTVSVPVLDDGHDEGEETFLLRLWNARGAVIADAEAVGTIENSDKMPKAWLARIGRAEAELVAESVKQRLEAPRAAGTEVTLAGHALASPIPGAHGAMSVAGTDDEAARLEAERLAKWLAGEDDEAPDEGRGMTGRELLTGSAFTLTSASEDGARSAALWGRGAVSSFSGRDGLLTIDGEVTSATLGADYAAGRWLGGLMVKHSLGEGSYSGDGGSGTVESTLTGIYPYGAVDVNDRLRAWAAAGLGEGMLTLTPENPETGADDRALKTDMSLGMMALGAKGALVEPGAGGGLRLGVETDAFWVRTSSDALRSEAGNLEAAQADVTRLRLGLDGGYVFALEGGATLEPTFELGLRHDGGDAETGYGVDVGGGLAWTAPALGLSAQISGRGLLAHEAAGLRDRGISGALAWDPDPASDRGPTLTLTQAMGAASAGGADALLGRQTLADLAANDNGFEARRLEVKLGYGLPAFGERFTSTPELGFGLSPQSRDYRLGWRLGLARSGPASFELGLEATRNEPANDEAEPEHGVGFTLEAKF